MPVCVKTTPLSATLRPIREAFGGSEELRVQAAKSLRKIETQSHLWSPFYSSFRQLLECENLGISAKTYGKYCQLIAGDFATIHPEIFKICGVIGANQVLNLTPGEQTELLRLCREYAATAKHPPSYQWIGQRIREMRGESEVSEFNALIGILRMLARRLAQGGICERAVLRAVKPGICQAIKDIQKLLENRNLDSHID